MTSPPTLTGEPHVGRPLTVKPGVVGPSGVTATYKWLRDGEPIGGANAQTYTPVAADLKHRLGVRVTYAKPGYTSIVQTLALSAPVRTHAAIRAKSRSHRTVTLVLRAEGVRYVRGEVTLVSPRGERRTRTLERGSTTFRAKWIRAGERTFTVIYTGERRVDARTVTKTLVVR